MSTNLHSFISPSNFGSHLLLLSPNVMPVATSHALDLQGLTFTAASIDFGPIGSVQSGIQPLFECPHMFGEEPKVSEMMEFISIRPPSLERVSDQRVGSWSAAEAAAYFQHAALKLERFVFMPKRRYFGVTQKADEKISSLIEAIVKRSEINEDIADCTRMVVAGMCLRNPLSRVGFSNVFETSAIGFANKGDIIFAAITTEIVMKNYEVLLENPVTRERIIVENVITSLGVSAYNAARLWQASAFETRKGRRPIEMLSNLVEDAASGADSPQQLDMRLKLSRALYFGYYASDVFPEYYAHLNELYAGYRMVSAISKRHLFNKDAFDAYLRAAYYRSKDENIDWKKIHFNLDAALSIAEMAGEEDGVAMMKLEMLRDVARGFAESKTSRVRLSRTKTTGDER